MEKTRFEKFKEKVNEMSIEEIAELMDKLGLNPCDFCPFGEKKEKFCRNEVCVKLEAKELFMRYLEGEEE